jgi:hypothetical protein
VRQRLRLRKLVFVQCGSAFEPLREAFLEYIGGHRVSVPDIALDSEILETDQDVICVTDVHLLARTGQYDGLSMGDLRALLDSFIDDGKTVCLVSRAPRMSFRPVPGSSIIDDAAPVFLPLLTAEETGPLDESTRHNAVPTIGLDADVEVTLVLCF